MNFGRSNTEIGRKMADGRLSLFCEQFNNDGAVCPHKLWSSHFTTAAVNNIDYNLLLLQRIHFMAQKFQLFSIHHMHFKGTAVKARFSIRNLHTVLLLFYQVTQMYHQPLSSPKYQWLMGLPCPLPCSNKRSRSWMASNIDGSITEATIRQNGLDIMVCISCK